MLTLRIRPEDLASANIEKIHHILPKIRQRMMILSSVAMGYSRLETAMQVGVCGKQVKRVIAMYNSGGLAAVRELRYRGPQSSLDPFRSSIESSFESVPPRTSAEAAARIAVLSGKELSVSAVKVFMKRIGMKCIKMGHIPAKADTDKQRSFYENTLSPLIDKAEAGGCHLFYMDAAHFILAPFVCMVWCFARKFIKAAAGRNRINVLGALHAKTHQLETIINTTYITATQVVEMLNLLAIRYVGLPIHIVMDNARYQHCQLVIEHAKSLNITLVFLPPYSPNLNIIERLWKFLREKILHAKYYPDPDTFHNAIRRGIQSVNTDPQWSNQIRSRLTGNFQFFDDQAVL